MPSDRRAVSCGRRALVNQGYGSCECGLSKRARIGACRWRCKCCGRHAGRTIAGARSRSIRRWLHLTLGVHGGVSPGTGGSVGHHDASGNCSGSLLLLAASAGQATAGWVLVALLAAGCTDVVYDDWGPSAGHAVVSGTVRSLGHTVTPGTWVDVSRCGAPIGGYFGSGQTDSAGRYQAEGHLPPVGLLPTTRLDTLSVRCYAFVGRDGLVRDSLLIRFAPSAQLAAQHTLDLMVP